MKKQGILGKVIVKSQSQVGYGSVSGVYLKRDIVEIFRSKFFDFQTVVYGFYVVEIKRNVEGVGIDNEKKKECRKK